MKTNGLFGVDTAAILDSFAAQLAESPLLFDSTQFVQEDENDQTQSENEHNATLRFRAQLQRVINQKGRFSITLL